MIYQMRNEGYILALEVAPSSGSSAPNKLIQPYLEGESRRAIEWHETVWKKRTSN